MQPLVAMLIPSTPADGAVVAGRQGQTAMGQNGAAAGFDALVAGLIRLQPGMAAEAPPLAGTAELPALLARPDQTADGAAMAAALLQVPGLQAMPAAPVASPADGEIAGGATAATALAVAEPSPLPSPSALPVAAPGASPAAPVTGHVARPVIDHLARPVAGPGDEAPPPAVAPIAAHEGLIADGLAPTSPDLPAPPVAPAAAAMPAAAPVAAAAADGAAPDMAQTASLAALAPAVERPRAARTPTMDTPRVAVDAAPVAVTDRAAARVPATATAAGLSAGQDGQLPPGGTVDTQTSTMATSLPPLGADGAASPVVAPAAGHVTVAGAREMAVASTHMARAGGAAHLPPAAQLTGRIEQAVAQGQTTLTVRLDPETLGRVEVKLELQDGRVTASIAAERPATLELLQRDARLLERAVEQSGLQLSDAGMQFSLREGAGQWAEAQGGSKRGAFNYGPAAAEPAVDPLAPAIAAYQSDSLVDIQI